MIEEIIELAKTLRECYQRAVVKATADQLGEAFVGLDERRREPNAMRGQDRRVA